jgi:hypothetical protein
VPPTPPLSTLPLGLSKKRFRRKSCIICISLSLSPFTRGSNALFDDARHCCPVRSVDRTDPILAGISKY